MVRRAFKQPRDPKKQETPRRVYVVFTAEIVPYTVESVIQAFVKGGEKLDHFGGVKLDQLGEW